MQKTLLITVGGSPAPIATSINTLQPERVVFICSTGSRGSISQVLDKGTPCKIREKEKVVESLPNLPTQLKLTVEQFNSERDLVRLDYPDDLADCYEQIKAKVITIQKEQPGAELLADYTGGTKTMSLALGSIALDYGLQLHLTTRERTNLIRVERGESTELVTASSVTAQRSLQQLIPMFLAQHNYAAAIAELSQLQLSQLPRELKLRVRRYRDAAAAFEAWDRFEYHQAWELFQSQMRDFRDSALFLKRVMTSRADIDQDFDFQQRAKKFHGYEVVEDLLLNAERRAQQKRYDDAVARLYRAIELLAQVDLWRNHNIRTGDVQKEQLPKAWKGGHQHEDKIQLSLMQSYDFLIALNATNPLGVLFERKRSAIKNILQVRNYSQLAHGFTPVTQASYEKVDEVLGGFVRKGIALVAKDYDKHSPVPFPLDFPEGLD